LKANKKLGAMYTPTEIDPNRYKGVQGSPAGRIIGYNNQSTGIIAANASYLDTKVMERKAI
jgi:hypothetical protein